MNLPDARYLEPFAAYLRTLGQDVLELAAVVERGGHSPAQRHLVGGLNYVFKSLDLIPDGIDDLGYLDDAFVLRVAAALAQFDGALQDAGVERLAREAADVRDFLGAEHERLERYVRGLARVTARGRAADAILGDEEVRRAFVVELRAWARDYEAPTFTSDVKTLVKLRAFLGAKLPA